MDQEFLGQEESEENERYLSHEDDELDAHIILLVLLSFCQIMCLKKRQRELQLRIEHPIRCAITRVGQDYIENVLKEDPYHFRELYRMYPYHFRELYRSLKLCNLLREKTSLTDTRFISLEEMVASFLLVIGQNSRYCYSRDTFKRSKFAINENFHKVLRALNQISPSFMATAGPGTPQKIKESTRFYPYFKDCVGAIDGTHIFAMVQKKDAAPFRNRKGDISQNVLAACNFDLEFIYVLSGWEGSAHDSKILNDALTRNTNRLPVPEGKFYLVDCGFGNRRNFLAPYRGVRYHLQEFSGEDYTPQNDKELFNHRHASLRNVIERIFGIFKSRFLIFKSAPPFPYKTQTEIVLACVGLHNFLRKFCRTDNFPEETKSNGEEARKEVNDNDEEILETQDQQKEHANQVRATIATNMWRDFTL